MRDKGGKGKLRQTERALKRGTGIKIWTGQRKTARANKNRSWGGAAEVFELQLTTQVTIGGRLLRRSIHCWFIMCLRIRALGSDGGYDLHVQMRKLRLGEIRIWV